MIKAMAGERKQKKKVMLNRPKTPKKPKKPDKPLIGSSSTWNEEQLELFKVKIGTKVTEVKSLIPKKWFEFGNLEHYQSGNAYTLRMTD